MSRSRNIGNIIQGLMNRAPTGGGGSSGKLLVGGAALGAGTYVAHRTYDGPMDTAEAARTAEMEGVRRTTLDGPMAALDNMLAAQSALNNKWETMDSWAQTWQDMIDFFVKMFNPEHKSMRERAAEAKQFMDVTYPQQAAEIEDQYTEAIGPGLEHDVPVTGAIERVFGGDGENADLPIGETAALAGGAAAAYAGFKIATRPRPQGPGAGGPTDGGNTPRGGAPRADNDNGASDADEDNGRRRKPRGKWGRAAAIITTLGVSTGLLQGSFEEAAAETIADTVVPEAGDARLVLASTGDITASPTDLAREDVRVRAEAGIYATEDAINTGLSAAETGVRIVPGASAWMAASTGGFETVSHALEGNYGAAAVSGVTTALETVAGLIPIPGVGAVVQTGLREGIGGFFRWVSGGSIDIDHSSAVETVRSGIDTYSNARTAFVGASSGTTRSTPERAPTFDRYAPVVV